MSRQARHIIRHPTDDPFFIACAGSLRDDDGNQIATITSIDSASLEKRETEDPDTWSEAVDATGFSNLQVLDDPATSFTDDMLAGYVSISTPSPQPDAGDDYRLVLHCTITFVATYGSGTAKKDFVRLASIASSLETAPSA